MKKGDRVRYKATGREGEITHISRIFPNMIQVIFDGRRVPMVMDMVLFDLLKFKGHPLTNIFK